MVPVSPDVDPKPRSTLSWSRLIRQLVVILALAMGLYLGLTLWAGAGALRAASSRLGLADIALMFGLVTGGWLLRGLRWHYFTRYLGWPVPAAENLLIFLASFTFTATPGKAGEVVKSALLKQRFGIPISESAGVLLIERLQDLIAVLLLAGGGLGLLDRGQTPFWTCLALVSLLTLFVWVPALHRGILARIGRWIRPLRRLTEKLLVLLQTGRRLLGPAPFALGMLLALVSWAMEGLTLWIILRALAIEIPMLVAFSLYGIATVVGALSMLPGGIGSFEVLLIIMLKTPFGVSDSLATTATLLIRTSTMWLVTLLGLVFLAVWWRWSAGERNDAG